MTDSVIRSVRPWGGELSDVTILDNMLKEITPVGQHDPASNLIEGRGRILLPAFTDAHVHLDSTRIGLPFRPHSGGTTIAEQVANDRANWRDAGASVADRATETLGRAILHGMTRARSYAQIDSDCRLDRFEGVLAAREHHAARARVEIIAFPQAGLVTEPGAIDLIDEALRQGADVVGGLDPCAIDSDPKGQLDALFDLAERHSKPIDVHLHEPGELGLFSMRLIAERVRALGMAGLVTISHAFALATATETRLAAVLDEFAELNIALTTIAPSGARVLPLREIVSRGIRIGLGQDGQRDYWSPYGTTDMLERAYQLAFTNGFRRDADFELAADIATRGGADVMGGAAPARSGALTIGDPADFVLIEGETVTAAMLDRLPGRGVIRAGRLIAENDEFLS